ncbi:MAG: EpsG family protein [Bergeyella sp.]|nr:EpsG family protein [Bergeyella sp.]
MVILHWSFIIIFVFLAYVSYHEIFILKRKNPVFSCIAWLLLVVVIGLRLDVGADYPVYRKLFVGFSMYTGYQDVFDKALFRKSREEIEWIFVLINKIIFDLGLPFYFVTLVAALISVSLKLITLYQNIAYPMLGVFFYFMPIMFFEDSGQMRQGLGIAMCVFSFRFIKSRNLFMYLLFMYLALGMHKTAIVFLPAYWLVKIPLNGNRIFWLILFSILISPLEPYKFFGGLFEFLSPEEVSSAYTGYVNDKYYGTELETGLGDIVKIIYIIILMRFDDQACKKVEWYEYMRNIAVFGLCFFYVMRTNSIFAVRLPGVYMFFLTMFCLPSIVYAVEIRMKQILYYGFFAYFSAMFFYFGKGNGDRGSFTMNKYENVLF